MNCLRAMPVCSLVNDKGIESTFYKAPRPSARVLTLSHAPTPKQVSPAKNCEVKGDAPQRLNSVCLANSIAKLVLLISGRLVAQLFCLLVHRSTASSTFSMFHLFFKQYPAFLSSSSPAEIQVGNVSGCCSTAIGSNTRGTRHLARTGTPDGSLDKQCSRRESRSRRFLHRPAFEDRELQY